MLDYKINKLNAHITQLSDATEVSCFLITGSKRAVLVDTGVGLKGLKENVEKLTSLPYDVVLTHGHGDHAGGVGAFERAFIFPVDIPMAIAHTKEMRYSYTASTLAFAAQMGGERLTAEREDFVPELDEHFAFMPLTDGQTFDLGGLTVGIIAVPGHTRGTCCILVREDRYMLFGDACNINTLVGQPESTTISEYLSSLLRLKTFEPEYDVVMYSHGPATGPSALDDNIELCRRILAGTDDRVPAVGLSGPGYYAAKKAENGFERADGKAGNIFYSDLTAR